MATITINIYFTARGTFFYLSRFFFVSRLKKWLKSEMQPHHGVLKHTTKRLKTKENTQIYIAKYLKPYFFRIVRDNATLSKKQKLSAFCFHHFLSRLNQPHPPEKHHSFLLIVYFFCFIQFVKIRLYNHLIIFFLTRTGHTDSD